MYKVYGFIISTPIEVGLNPSSTIDKADITIKSSETKLYCENEISWYHSWKEGSNSTKDSLSAGKRKDQWYILYFHFEKITFAINPNGSEIFYHLQDPKTKSTLKHLILNHVIPLVINHKGIEVLHASSILISNGAILFVGGSGYGKSTIATGLIKNGFGVISDDATPIFFKNNQFFIKNGPPEMNLWPHARNLLNLNKQKVNNPRKELIQLRKNQHVTGSFPFVQIYLLKPQEENTEISIESLSKKETLLELLKSTLRLDITNKNMLQNQLTTLKKIVDIIPTKALTYKKNIPDINKLCSAIVSDIKNQELNKIAI